MIHTEQNNILCVSCVLKHTVIVENLFWNNIIRHAGLVLHKLNFFLFVLSFCPLRVVLSKGQVSTSHYRFLAKCGGFVWAETQATILYNSKTSQPEAVVCLNFILRYLNKKWEHLLWGTTIRQYHTWGCAVIYYSIIVVAMQFGHEATWLEFDSAFMQPFLKKTWLWPSWQS